MRTPWDCVRCEDGSRSSKGLMPVPNVQAARRDDSTRVLMPSSEARRRHALETARVAVERLVASRTDVVCAFVAGSAANPECDYWSDVDVRVVVDGDVAPSGAFELCDGVPLEWAYVALGGLLEADALRRHPFRAPEIEEGTVLYDPTGFLVDLQRTLRAESVGRRSAGTRASVLLTHAVERLRVVEETWGELGLLALWDYRCVLFWGVEAASIHAGLRPTHRRALVVLRDCAATQAAYLGASEALGSSYWDQAAAVETWRDTLRLMIGLPDALRSQHHYLASGRIELWDSDVRGMIDSGDFREIALPVWTLLTLVWSASEGMPELRDDCGAVLARMGFERPHGVESRLVACRRWIDLLLGVVGVADGASARVSGV